MEANACGGSFQTMQNTNNFKKLNKIKIIQNFWFDMYFLKILFYNPKREGACWIVWERVLYIQAVYKLVANIYRHAR